MVTEPIGLLQARHELIVDAFMHEEAAQRRAALAGGTHGGKGDAAQRQVEIGRRVYDRGVVAAKFEDGAGEANGEGARSGQRGPWQLPLLAEAGYTRSASTWRGSTSRMQRAPGARTTGTTTSCSWTTS